MFNHAKFILLAISLFIVFNMFAQIPFYLARIDIYGSVLKFSNTSSLFLAIFFAGYLSAGRSLPMFREVVGFTYKETYRGAPYILLNLLLSILFFFLFDPVRDYYMGSAILAIMLVVISTVFISPVIEEVIFRGYFFGLVERNFGRWVALIFTSVIFVIAHTGYDLSTLIILLPFSILFGVARMITGSVYCSILMHVIFNAFVFIGYAIKCFIYE